MTQLRRAAVLLAPCAPVPYAQTAVWVREDGDWKAINTHQSVRGGWPQVQ